MITSRDGDVTRKRLRATFDEVAELYDRARPRYPTQLFDDPVALARVPPGGHVLEIGPGQATLPIAGRGFSVVAVELGPGLAAAACRNLTEFDAS